jgi:beta-aspartyl-peptidase (threonine type)
VPVATLIVHGGAGRWDPRIPRAEIDPGLDRALETGWRALEDGALSAVVAAVTALEDDPHFNAGIGAVRNADGEVELDAGVMTTERLRTGAVAGMTDSARPVSVARAVLEDGRHVLLAGAGASRFAAERGLPLAGREHLRESARALPGSAGGTVGAVCRDDRGGLAVAVSTGGVSGKFPGRVGDSAICGAGFYADTPGAACATGQGEAFIRLAGCRRAVEMLAAGLDAPTCAARLIEELAERVGGEGGIIVVDAAGRPGVARNTRDMPWAWRTEAGAARWSSA